MKKMKKIFNKSLILALLTGFVFTSCEKELDQIPHDNYSLDIAFVTYEDFENGIRGVYSLLRGAATYGGSDGGCMLSAPDILADNPGIYLGFFIPSLFTQFTSAPSRR